MNDYFLYDNRSWAPGPGTDWGLKAATGVLAGEKIWQRAFVNYCELIGSQGPLRNFTAALGGVRIPDSQLSSYLLCITLEQSDFRGRPSWAVVGFYFLNATDLSSALQTSDVIGAARIVCDADPKPMEALFPPDHSKVLQPPPFLDRALTHRGRPLLMRFQAESVSQVESLLFCCHDRGLQLPAILGIVSVKNLNTDRLLTFDLVLCHPVDARGEEVLKIRLAEQADWLAKSEDVEKRAGLTKPGPAAQQPGSRSAGQPRVHTVPQPQTSFSDLAVMLLLVAAVLFVALLFVDPVAEKHEPIEGERDIPQEQETASPALAPSDKNTLVLDEHQQTSRRPGPDEPGKLESSEISDEFYAFEIIIDEFEELDRSALISSRPFHLAKNLRVRREYQGKLMAVREALEHLQETQELVAGNVGTTLSFYTRDRGRNLPPEQRVKHMRDVLNNEWKNKEPDCAILREAFGFEFEKEESELSKWCSLVAGLKHLQQGEK